MARGFSTAVRSDRHGGEIRNMAAASSGGGGSFVGGNVTYSSIQAMGAAMAATGTPTSPVAGGTLSINGVPLGSYDYTIKSGPQTISSFVESNWFTATEDTVAAFIVVQGSLTIDAAQIVAPSKRKLFTVVYVDGNLTINGSVSMSARGANHSGAGVSGGATSSGAIRIATGTFSGVTNPQVPAAGAAGGAQSTWPGGGFGLSTPNNGSAGANGATGGGGSGQGGGTGIGTGGAGAAGTAFSGGPGGGGADNRAGGSIAGGDGGANGGSGGTGANQGGGNAAGATGNPGGVGASSPDGNAGTGGVLFVIVTGTLNGSGTVQANGVAGVSGGGRGGGASGGGSVTVLYGVNASTVAATATGGAGDSSGNGGDGTARLLAL